MTKCPHCDFEAADAHAEAEHMNSAHRDIVEARMRRAGVLAEVERTVTPFTADPASLDIPRFTALLLDLMRYRKEGKRDLARAAWLELRDLVMSMPEAQG